MDFKNLFLSPNGRTGRSQFWIGILILFVVCVVLFIIPLIGWLIAIVGGVYCSVCLYSKRLHDFGQSGWLAAIPAVLSIVTTIMSLAAAGIALASMAGGASHDQAAVNGMLAGLAGLALISRIAGLIGLGFLLWAGLMPGNPGDNKYGPPPVKAAPAAAT